MAKKMTIIVTDEGHRLGRHTEIKSFIEQKGFLVRRSHSHTQVSLTVDIDESSEDASKLVRSLKRRFPEEQAGVDLDFKMHLWFLRNPEWNPIFKSK